MPLMTISNPGYAAIQAARRSGVRIQPGTFKVGTAAGYRPFASMTALNGLEFYDGPVTECYLLNNDTAVFVCIVPNDSEEATAGEIAVCLGDDIFALGVLAEPYRKTTNFYLRLLAFVQADGIGEALDTNYAAPSPLPKVVGYDMVGTPDEARHETYAVLDGHKVSAITDSTKGPSLVVKSSTVDNEATWLGVNSACAYSGKPLAAPANSGSPLKTNFLLSFNATAADLSFAHIVSGPGIGQMRGVAFDPVTSVYSASPVFSPMPTVDSVIEIWGAVGIGAGRKNNSCTAAIVWDEDDAGTPLTVPAALCQTPGSTTRVKSTADATTSKVKAREAVNTLLAGAAEIAAPTVSSPQVSVAGVPLGVHFSGSFFCDPYGVVDVPASGPSNLKVRLERVNPTYGNYSWSRFFNPALFDEVSQFSRPFITEASMYGADNQVAKPPESEQALVNQMPVPGTRQITDFLPPGDYPTFEMLKNCLGVATLDGICVSPGVRLMVWEKPNQQGRVLLDVDGPIVIASLCVYNFMVYGTIAYERRAVSRQQLGLDVALEDTVWQGYSASVWPRSVRFYADETLKDLSGVVQETPNVVMLDMRQWDGSIKIIDLKQAGGTSQQTTGRFSTSTDDVGTSISLDGTTGANNPGGVASTAPVVVVSASTVTALPPPSVFVPEPAPAPAPEVIVWPEEPAPPPPPTPVPPRVPPGSIPAKIKGGRMPVEILIAGGPGTGLNPNTSISGSDPDGLTSRLDSDSQES